MHSTLLILAAGMGSRYGGLKQIDPFGPHGETIMDYSVYDALNAGFSKVVFVIRHAFEAEFRANIGRKYEGRVDVEYVFQEMDTLPPGFSAPAGRTKPWGTTHAIWCARTAVKTPFLSINADDYYGKQSYQAAAAFLSAPVAGSVPEYCVVGYPLLATLSDHGTVTRAVCDVDGEGFLKGLVERAKIDRANGTGRYLDDDGTAHSLRGDELVSMNMLGFTPALFPQLEDHLIRFLDGPARKSEKAESVIPSVLGDILAEKAARVRVVPTTANWFGVTYTEDRPGVIAAFEAMAKRGNYPSPLWSQG